MTEWFESTGHSADIAGNEKAQHPRPDPGGVGPRPEEMKPGGRPPRPFAERRPAPPARAPERGRPGAPAHGRPAAPAHARPGAPERGRPHGAPERPRQHGGATRNRDVEIKVCGRHACRALFERRAARILRVYLKEELVKPFGDLLHTCAELHRPYKIVDDEELERITESRHHEGICVVASAEAPPALAEILAAPGPAWLVALAGVENPHNTGAIVRTAAHFGARAVLIEGVAKRLPPVVYRTAQGGAEGVEVAAGARAAGGARRGAARRLHRDLRDVEPRGASTSTPRRFRRAPWSSSAPRTPASRSSSVARPTSR